MNYEGFLQRQAALDVSAYVEPFWVANSLKLRQLLTGNVVDPDFINSSNFYGFTGGPDVWQLELVSWLFDNVDSGVLARLMPDPSFGGLRRWATAFARTPVTAKLRTLVGETSPISIMHMATIFQAAEIVPFDIAKFRQVIHWGGGFGNQARIFATINPDLVQYIVDLPMTGVLQHAFLSESLEQPVQFLEGDNNPVKGVNLVSPAFLDRVPCGVDLLIATHSLNESTAFAQNKVVTELNWFDAAHLMVSWMEDCPDFSSEANANWMSFTAEIKASCQSVAGIWAR